MLPTDEEFLANQARVLQGFGNELPEVTQRSGGLDSQLAIIVGFAPDSTTADQLSDAACQMEGVFPYGKPVLHSTIGTCNVVKPKGDAMLPDPAAYIAQYQPTLDILARVIGKVARRARGAEFGYGPLSLLANGDTIIATAKEPTQDILDIRRGVLEGAVARHRPLTPSWGLHLTAARLTEETTNFQRAAINKLLGQTWEGGSPAELFVGALVVTNGTFELVIQSNHRFVL